jgi:hypothetical protein
MTERKTLNSILNGYIDTDKFRAAWDTTEAAEEFKPLPAGEYTFRVVSGEPFATKTDTPGYRLTLEVAEGEYEGRRTWHSIWLTVKALPMAKRDLAKLGITDLAQLDQPLPRGILVRGKLSLRVEDDGTERNRLVRFEAAGTEPGDAFEPPVGAQVSEQKKAPDADGGGATGFNFGANAKGGQP